MEDIAIQLVHGRTKHTVQINPMLPLRSLMDKVEELTGIPQSGQKLICQGQTLTSQACVLLIYSDFIFQRGSCPLGSLAESSLCNGHEPLYQIQYYCF